MFPIKDNLPTDRFPFATLALIVASLVVYLLAIRHGGSLISGPDATVLVKYGAIPYALRNPGTHCGLAQIPGGAARAVACHAQHAGFRPSGGAIPVWETVFSAMFVHASIVQIAGNMLFLWIFGNNVEGAMGPLKFIAFYIAGGVAALALEVLLVPSAAAPTVGAAGGIAAVLGGYILLYPRARVLTLVLIPLFSTVIEVPALVMLGIWFVMQALFGAAGLTDPIGGGGVVAYFAYAGGFAFGLAATWLLASRRRQAPPGDSDQRRLNAGFARPGGRR
ncbi:MAG: rhomboid family intramembrane serine protease [Actinomycetota bacterium]|nr:rhomboid family intramembrane serine protease [Actinomycetota bacterium]